MLKILPNLYSHQKLNPNIPFPSYTLLRAAQCCVFLLTYGFSVIIMMEEQVVHFIQAFSESSCSVF